MLPYAGRLLRAPRNSVGDLTFGLPARRSVGFGRRPRDGPWLVAVTISVFPGPVPEEARGGALGEQLTDIGHEAA